MPPRAFLTKTATPNGRIEPTAVTKTDLAKWVPWKAATPHVTSALQRAKMAAFGQNWTNRRRSVPLPGVPGILGYAVPTHPSRASLSLVVDRDHHRSSDGDLGRALVAGAPWAVRETWHRFAPMVLRMAERSLGSRAEADDIVQEVFHHVFRKAKTLREPESLRAFVYSFAVRELKSELRRKKVRGWLSFQQPEALAEASGPALDVESRDLVRACYALLDRLSPRDRLVFVLRRVEAMTVEEIAAAMELSPSTVKRSMLHAASRLTRWLDADPDLAELLNVGVGRA